MKARPVIEVARDVLDLTSYEAANRIIDKDSTVLDEAVKILSEWANAIIDEAVDSAVEKTLEALRSGIKVIE